MLTLHQSSLTVSECIDLYAFWYAKYVNHSQNQEDGEDDKSGSHLCFIEG